jgi:fluoroacetyl-CoA thioesterase
MDGSAMNFTVGARNERRVTVTPDIAIAFLGDENARVLSTPQMINGMERTCRELALPMLPPGFDTVGTHVDVYHLAAASVGDTVLFTAELTGAGERRLEFHVEAWCGELKIGEGAHERAIIDRAKFAARQAARKLAGNASDRG